MSSANSEIDIAWIDDAAHPTDSRKNRVSNLFLKFFHVEVAGHNQGFIFRIPLIDNRVGLLAHKIAETCNPQVVNHENIDRDESIQTGILLVRNRSPDTVPKIADQGSGVVKKSGVPLFDQVDQRSNSEMSLTCSSRTEQEQSPFFCGDIELFDEFSDPMGGVSALIGIGLEIVESLGLVSFGNVCFL